MTTPRNAASSDPAVRSTPYRPAAALLTEEEMRAAVRHNYDGIAPYYDRQLVEECGYATPQRVAAELASLGARGLFVDLGAGTGLVGRAISAAKLPIELVAIDLSPAMLDAIDASQSVYVDRICKDLTLDLPFEAGRFDGAIAAGLLEHVVDPAALFARVHRVLRPRAPFLLSFPPASSSELEIYDRGAAAVAHPRRSIEQCLLGAGFHIGAAREGHAYRDGRTSVVHVLLVAIRDDRTL